MKNKALLCGINNYQSQSDLRGCINDVANIRRLLIDNFDFTAANIHQLLDEEVIKTNIKQEWQWLIKDTEPGTHLVFHFSGHGSYVPDDRGDEDDGYDEITCLYDMDFASPVSFMRDDEWNQMIEQIPSGVMLTFIMDTCHSGTGTRMLSVDMGKRLQRVCVHPQMSESRSLVTSGRSMNNGTSNPELLDREQYQQLLKNKTAPLYRFIVPPPEMQERVVKIARTRVLSKPKIAKDNWLLLAACQSDQTAADAYIERDFHGAFTYYFCQVVSESTNLSSQKILDLVAQKLEQQGFAQKPQHEGKELSGVFFSGNKDTPVKPSKLTFDPNLPSTMTPTHPLDTTTKKLLIEAYLKLLDTVAGTQDTQKLLSRTATATHHLVYVHGISRHIRGYSNSWWNALKPHVEGVYGDGDLDRTRTEVIWSDLVNRRDLITLDREKQEQLRYGIELILEERRRKYIEANMESDRAITLESETSDRGGDFSLDDFLIYMTNSRMRQKIIDRFTSKLKPLLETGSAIDIISHSWGTVVAYEGLRELETDLRSFSGKVINLFTIGSALSISPVRSSLRTSNRDGRCPALVENWINLDAKGDLVGGMLRDRFDVTREFLELEPTECRRSWFGYNLGCAHGSYFQNNNLAVNRDIFARFII